MNGPDAWFTLPNFEMCAGNMQSPIDLEVSTLTYNGNLLPINFNNYDKNVLWNIANNGDNSIYLIFSLKPL